MKTIIQLEFLNVGEAKEYLVTVPEGSTAEDLARLIRDTLRSNPGHVLTGAYIDHEIKKED